eukprot:gene15543-17128_t
MKRKKGSMRSFYKERKYNPNTLTGEASSSQSLREMTLYAYIQVNKIILATGRRAKYPFRQNSDFSYFSGVQEPDAAVVLETRQGYLPLEHKMILFLKQSHHSRDIWDGPSTSLHLAQEYFGATEAYPVASFTSFLNENYGRSSHCIWYNDNKGSFTTMIEKELNTLFASAEFKSKVLFFGHNLQILRLIKSSAEIDLLAKSASIGSMAIRKVMLHSKQNVDESFLHALFEYECKIQGAQRLAFTPVVAGGEAANTLHYVNNSQLLRDGDLLLMDAGCEFNGYACDITRTWPVSGKFNKAQKELYEIVLRVQLKSIELCRIGISLNEVHQEMLSNLGTELQNVGLIDKMLSAHLLKKEASKFCPHHVGHYLGMDIHDTPLVHRGLPLSPGMVITVEPGLYIPKDSYHLPSVYRGIGIRIEDDILISEKGPVVLSEACPKTVQDIERLLSR